MNNDEIRRQMRALRKDLPAEAQEAASRAVHAHLLAFEPYRRAQTVMAYIAARGELSLTPVIEDVLSSGRRLALPRCEAPGVMTARWIERKDQLVSGAYGLWEPSKDCEIAAPEEINLILVPGTAFDRQGGRIGQGGGYYDRFLPKTRALTVGVCHDFALLKSLDLQAHDVRMDVVAAPGGLNMTK